MNSKTFSVIYVIILISFFLTPSIVMAEDTAYIDSQIDYTCYLGCWTANNRWIQVRIDEINENSMNFDFFVHEKGAYVSDASIVNNVASGDFARFMDDTIAPSEYWFTGNVTLFLSENGIRMRFTNTSYSGQPQVSFVDLSNPNFICREKNTTQSDINVELNGVQLKFDQKPITVNNRTLVPLRFISESLGATVNWNEQNREITLYNENKTVKFIVGQAIIMCDGVEIELDVFPVIVNSRTLVPVRAISEAFGCNVIWNEATQTVSIYK